MHLFILLIVRDAKHIKNIHEEKELEESTTMQKFGNSEFLQKGSNYYSLDLIIPVGCHVKSQ